MNIRLEIAKRLAPIKFEIKEVNTKIEAPEIKEIGKEKRDGCDSNIM